VCSGKKRVKNVVIDCHCKVPTRNNGIGDKINGKEHEVAIRLEDRTTVSLKNRDRTVLRRSNTQI